MLAITHVQKINKGKLQSQASLEAPEIMCWHFTASNLQLKREFDGHSLMIVIEAWNSLSLVPVSKRHKSRVWWCRVSSYYINTMKVIYMKDRHFILVFLQLISLIEWTDLFYHKRLITWCKETVFSTAFCGHVIGLHALSFWSWYFFSFIFNLSPNPSSYSFSSHLFLSETLSFHPISCVPFQFKHTILANSFPISQPWSQNLRYV